MITLLRNKLIFKCHSDNHHFHENVNDIIKFQLINMKGIYCDTLHPNVFVHNHDKRGNK